MDKKTYKLNIKYITGDVVGIDLDNPHKLVPNNVQPHALVYAVENVLHNIPFSSILDFWFNPHDYNEVERIAGTQPTPNCECGFCRQKREELSKKV